MRGTTRSSGRVILAAAVATAIVFVLFTLALENEPTTFALSAALPPSRSDHGA